MRNLALLPTIVALSIALVTACAVDAGVPTPTVSSAADATQEGDPLEPLVDLIAQRLRTADAVSSATFGTPSPIDDPAREKDELDAAAAMASGQGLDPNVTRKIFSDQIEANKVIQYGLYARWTAHPDQAPKTKADLTTIRSQLNTITVDLIRDLASTKAARSDASCTTQLRSAERSVSRTYNFDPLHVEAFDRALISVCT